MREVRESKSKIAAELANLEEEVLMLNAQAACFALVNSRQTPLMEYSRPA